MNKIIKYLFWYLDIEIKHILKINFTDCLEVIRFRETHCNASFIYYFIFWLYLNQICEWYISNKKQKTI